MEGIVYRLAAVEHVGVCSPGVTKNSFFQKMEWFTLTAVMDGLLLLPPQQTSVSFPGAEPHFCTKAEIP